MQPQAYPDPSVGGMGVGAGAGAGPALFTPGLDQGQMQQQQSYYGHDAGAGGAPGYGQPGQVPVGYGQPPPQPGYGHGQPPVNQMVDQFAHMGMGGQKGVSRAFSRC